MSSCDILLAATISLILRLVVPHPSHAAGRKDLVVPLSRAAIGVGADGIIVDVHPTPETALCDGPQALLGNDLRELAQAVRRLPALAGL